MNKAKLLATTVVGASLAVSAVAFAADEMSESVEMNSLPSAVQQTIKSKAEGAEIVSVKREDDKSGKWNYEAVVKKNGKDVELEVDPHGKFIREHEPNS